MLFELYVVYTSILSPALITFLKGRQMCYERITQTVTKVLIKYTDSGDQDEYLDAMMFSYRTRIHTSTKYPLPPMYLMLAEM